MKGKRFREINRIRRGLQMRFAKIFKKQRVGILDFIKRIPILRNRVPQKKSLVFRFLSNIRKRMESIRAMERRKRFAVLGISVIFLLVAGFAVAGVIGSFSTGDINKGLVGHWPLDSTHLNSTTNRVDDIGGYGNHGTNSGASLTTDRHGQANGAMSFDGLSNYINCGNGESLKPTTAITVELWTKVNSTKSLQFCIGYGNTGYSGWWVGLSNNIVTWNIGNGTAFRRKTFDLSPNQLAWHHIVGTYDNVSVKLYVDGDYKGSLGLAGPINYTGLTACRIGQTEGLHVDRYFNGTIDEVRIYDRALSEPEIEKLYETYKPKFSVGGANKGLVGHWSLRPTSEKVGSDLITNGDMEGGFTGGVADGWTSTRGTPVDETTDVHNGSHAQKINNPAGNTGVVNQIVAGTTGKVYKVTFWAKKYKGSGGHVYDAGASHYFTTIIVNQDVFTKYTRTFVHDGVDLNLAFYATTNAVGDTNGIIFDDVSIKEIKTADNTPNSNHGEIYGAEIRNHGADFNGSSDYVDIGDQSNLESMSALTVTAWIKTTTTETNRAILAKWYTSAVSYSLRTNTSVSGKIDFHTGTSSGNIGSTSISSVNDGEWHHLVGVYNGTTQKLYIDGVEEDSDIQSGVISNSEEEVCVGVFCNGGTLAGYFSGNISDVLVYDRTLSADEVLELYQGADVAGAVLDMPLSDKTGFKDISGNDNHGTNYGADIIGEAGGFDGVNDYVDCGAGEHLNITDAITISAWVKLFATAANYQIIVSKRQTDVQWILGRDYTDNKWRFWVSSNGSDAHAASDNSIVETGLWVHLVGAYTGTALKFYRDGVEVYSGSYSLGIHSTLSDHVQIGRQLTGYYFNGQISDVKVYNRALSDGGVSVGEDAKGEIGALYDKGRSGSSVGTSTTNLNKGLVGQWDLKSKNEKVGGELVANGINWNDGNEDGLADGYSTLGVNAITTITTGSGFSGNIQKIEAGVTENTALIWDTSLEVGKVYRITAKVKTNNGGALHLVYGETATVSVPGDSAVHKIELTSQITQQYAGQIRFYVRSTAGDAQAGDWIEVDEFSVKELKTADSTPYGNHGTIYGATVGDDYTSFDGDGDYVESPDNNLVLNGNGEHKTVVAWVYQTTASQDRVAGVFESQGSSQPQYALFLTGSKLRVQLKDSSGYFCDAQSSLSYSAGTWEHIVFTYDESYVHFYLNGESAGSTACSGDIRSDSSPYFYIGTRGDIYINEMFNGNISNIKIYNRSLSGAEAKLLYDKGR